MGSRRSSRSRVRTIVVSVILVGLLAGAAVVAVVGTRWWHDAHRTDLARALAVAPGVDFDPVDGGRFIRMSFAGATADIKETLARLEAWLPKA